MKDPNHILMVMMIGNRHYPIDVKYFYVLIGLYKKHHIKSKSS